MKKRTIFIMSILVTTTMIFSVIAVQSNYLILNEATIIGMERENYPFTRNENPCQLMDLDNPGNSQIGTSEIQVTKRIWDGNNWVESIQANIGDIVTFKITITYIKICGIMAKNINVTDILPSCLDYLDGSASISWGNKIYTGESSIYGQQIEWYLTETYGILLYSEEVGLSELPNTVSITYDALVNENSEQCGSKNKVSVTATETCCGEHLYGSDDVTIFVPGSCHQPNVRVTKLVKEDSYGVYDDVITVDIGTIDWVTFKIVVENTGDIVLDVTVEDELPVGLTYEAGYASPREPDTIDGRMLYWYFDDVAPGQIITITFRASFDDCDTYVNTVDVTGTYGEQQSVSDSASAIVHVIGCCQSGDITVEKYVKEDCCGTYTNYLSVDINQYSYVTFKLVVHTTRYFEVVSIRDVLPTGLTYKAGSARVNGIYKAPVMKGTSLYWNFTSVPSGFTYTVTFEASLNDCGFFTNTATVKGKYDYSYWLTDDDTAIVNVYGCTDRLTVEKQVSLDNETWYDNTINAHIGDTLYFMINVSNKGTTTVSGVTVNDYLPSLLDYNEDGVPTPVLVTEDELTWFYPDIYAHSYEIIRYSATVVKDGTDHNVVNAAACGGSPSDEDSVTIHAKAGMYVQKKVSKDGVTWADKVTAAIGETVRFNLTICYYGPYFIFHINVTDFLPYGLAYADDADPRETGVVGNMVYWRLPGFIGNASSISIEFNATVINDGTHSNRVNVSAQECSGLKLYDEDTAIVEVEEGPSLFCQKTVQATNGSWVEKIDAEVGSNVRFNITIKHIGYYPWYGINVLDILPENMSYVTDSASLIYKGDTIVDGDDFRPSISGDELLWSNLNFYKGDWLYSGETMTIIFKAKVNEKELMTNRANITVLQCNLGTKFTCTDTAMVNGTEDIPDLVADAGGPYSGTVGSSVTFTGSAQGGVTPYSYAWDLDNDGNYNDGTGKTVSESWSTAGTYTIGLKVTDDGGTEDTDTAQVTIEEQNTQPNAPLTPDGVTSGTAGESYTYSTKATDPQGDSVRYQWDWGDGTISEWSQLYPSGVQVTATHIWEEKDTYQIRVRAQDEHNVIGDWSTALEVTMPKSKHTGLLWNILEYLMEHFPFLDRLLPQL